MEEGCPDIEGVILGIVEGLELGSVESARVGCDEG